MYQWSELDWLISNKPMEYAHLVLGGNFWSSTFKAYRGIG